MFNGFFIFLRWFIGCLSLLDVCVIVFIYYFLSMMKLGEDLIIGYCFLGNGLFVVLLKWGSDVCVFFFKLWNVFNVRGMLWVFGILWVVRSGWIFIVSVFCCDWL